MKCRTCDLDKPVNQFAWKVKNKKKQSSCKDCHNEWSKQHYQDNKAKVIRRSIENNQKVATENQRKMCKYLLDKMCIDCGENNLLVLDFDHLSNKEYNVARMLSFCSWNSILKEIEKCEVVCANCHRKRTQERANSYRFRFVRGLVA